MKRYDLWERGDGSLTELPDGEYVTYEDAQAGINMLRDGNLALGQQITKLRDDLTAANLERDALKGRLRTARNIIVDTQNFIHPTQVWRDTELMQRVIDKFLEEGQS